MIKPNHALIIAAALLLVAGSGFAAGSGRPNVIFILSDDHAPSAIGCYDKRMSPYAKTPNIDRLADEGVRLDRVYCTNAICGPSRASILTGQYGHRTGVTGNGKSLSPDRPNVAKELTASGYQAAVIGKWHLRERPSGFTYYEVFKGQGAYFSPKMFGPDDGDGKQDGTVYEGRFSADVVGERAVNWLRNLRDKEQPFVLMAHFKSCHTPRSFPDKFENMYDGVTIAEPPTLFEDESTRSEGRIGQGLTMSGTAVERFSKKEWPTGTVDFSGMSPEEARRAAHQKMAKDYLRCTAALDEGIGKIMKYADESGLLENTVVIYTSDQGYYVGEHNYIDKRWFLEEGVNMPFVIRYPKLFKPGTTNDDIILNIDFAPFLLELTGTKVPDYMQGRSFLANLKGNTPDDWRTSYYYHYWDHNNRPAHYGIQTRDHRLVFFYGVNLDHRLKEFLPWAFPKPKGKASKRKAPSQGVAMSKGFGWELFDLKRDPLETTNVYGNPENKEIIRKLREELKQLKEQYGDTDERFPELLERYNASLQQ